MSDSNFFTKWFNDVIGNKSEEKQLLILLRDEVNVKLDRLEEAIYGLHDIIVMENFENYVYDPLRAAYREYNAYINMKVKNVTFHENDTAFWRHCRDVGQYNPKNILEKFSRRINKYLNAFWNRYFAKDSQLLLDSYIIIIIEATNAGYMSVTCDRLMGNDNNASSKHVNLQYITYRTYSTHI